MSNLNQNLIQETVECLSKTFGKSDPEERKQAEKRLKDLGNIIYLFRN